MACLSTGYEWQRWNRVRILTRWPDPTRSLSVVKQILDNGLIAVSVTCQETQTVYWPKLFTPVDCQNMCSISVCPFVCMSLRHVSVLYRNGSTYISGHQALAVTLVLWSELLSGSRALHFDGIGLYMRNTNVTKWPHAPRSRTRIAPASSSRSNSSKMLRYGREKTLYNIDHHARSEFG